MGDDGNVPDRERVTEMCRSGTDCTRESAEIGDFVWQASCSDERSMDALAIAAASGIRARMESLEMLANNLANAGTAGFKADREQYSLYWAAESSAATAGGGAWGGVSPVVERNWIDFTQGPLKASGSPAHVGLDGPGFLAVQSGERVLYTRNGELQTARNGTLVTMAGDAVLGGDGKPIRIDPALALEIRGDGSVWQGGQQTGQLRLVEFSERQMLQKVGQNNFAWPGKPEDAMAARWTRVVQGSLEAANGGGAESAVRMVNVMRQFESLQKALQMNTEMSRRLAEEVAKV
jgi:flagellar basal-body rod protein FlgF